MLTMCGRTQNLFLSVNGIFILYKNPYTMSNPTKLLIPGDKANHALVGYVTYCLACIFLPTVSAVIPVIAIGAGKELRDMRAYKRPFDTKDFLYTVVGCIPALLVNLL